MKKFGAFLMIAALCLAVATPALAMSATANIQINIAQPAPPALASNNPGPHFDAYYVGEEVVLTATPDDSASYIWHKDGEVLLDETGAILTITSASDENNGIYTVIAVNECDDESSPSNQITVAVYDRVEVTITATANPEAVEGEYVSCSAITLTADVPGNTYGILTYQWSWSHTPSQGETPIDGATYATYVIDPATSLESRTYNVEVTDGMGRDPMP